MKLSFTIFSFAFLLIAASAYGQENEIPANENPTMHPNSEIINVDDKPLLFELDSKALKRDSTQQKATPASGLKIKADQKPSSSKEDDALSFNFLYYIIQKFKISDLVDN